MSSPGDQESGAERFERWLVGLIARTWPAAEVRRGRFVDQPHVIATGSPALERCWIAVHDATRARESIRSALARAAERALEWRLRRPVSERVDRWPIVVSRSSVRRPVVATLRLSTLHEIIDSPSEANARGLRAEPYSPNPLVTVGLHHLLEMLQVWQKEWSSVLWAGDMERIRNQRLRRSSADDED